MSPHSASSPTLPLRALLYVSKKSFFNEFELIKLSVISFSQLKPFDPKRRMRRKLSSLEALNLLIIFATSPNAFFLFHIQFFSQTSSSALSGKIPSSGVVGREGWENLLDEGKVG
jgi:hypothetical protein